MRLLLLLNLVCASLWQRLKNTFSSCQGCLVSEESTQDQLKIQKTKHLDEKTASSQNMADGNPCFQKEYEVPRNLFVTKFSVYFNYFGCSLKFTGNKKKYQWFEIRNNEEVEKTYPFYFCEFEVKQKMNVFHVSHQGKKVAKINPNNMHFKIKSRYPNLNFFDIQESLEEDQKRKVPSGTGAVVKKPLLIRTYFEYKLKGKVTVSKNENHVTISMDCSTDLKSAGDLFFVSFYNHYLLIKSKSGKRLLSCEYGAIKIYSRRPNLKNFNNGFSIHVHESHFGNSIFYN